jgi:fumarate hydratase subunit beta
MYKKITSPLDENMLDSLRAGDYVNISGIMYTARDAAHKRMWEALNRGEKLPFDIKGQIIYYAGPCPAKPGSIVGPIGPTTSGRMDKYAPLLIQHGLRGMIGKGDRDIKVVEAMVENKAVYFAAIGGLGAYIANSIKKRELVAYEDLGTEALTRLTVIDFPAIVAIDCKGNNLYKTESDKYKNKYSDVISSLR